MNNPEQSQFPSIKLDQLVYVELEASNGGMMLTVSEDGFTFRAVTPVGPGRKIGFSFVVNGTEKLEGHGNIDWTQDGGKVASLQFDDVTPEFHIALRRWLTQLSAPAVPSFLNEHFVNADFAESRTSTPARDSAVAPLANPDGNSADEPIRTPSLSEFASFASPLSGPGPRETFLINDWEYPRRTQGDSRLRIRGVAIAAVVIVVVALTFILYGYHDSVGQLLISLGQKMSAPREVSASQPSSAPQPVKIPDVTKSPAENPQPASPAPAGNLATSSAKALINDSGYRTEKASAPGKQSAFRDFASQPANSTPEPEDQDPADRIHSLWAAVAHGNTSAEVTLAKLYLIGGGVTKSCDQARVLLQAAAKKGNGEALDKLSQINQQGCP